MSKIGTFFFSMYCSSSARHHRPPQVFTFSKFLFNIAKEAWKGEGARVGHPCGSYHSNTFNRPKLSRAKSKIRKWKPGGCMLLLLPMDNCMGLAAGLIHKHKGCQTYHNILIKYCIEPVLTILVLASVPIVLPRCDLFQQGEDLTPTQ